MHGWSTNWRRAALRDEGNGAFGFSLMIIDTAAAPSPRPNGSDAGVIEVEIMGARVRATGSGRLVSRATNKILLSRSSHHARRPHRLPVDARQALHDQPDRLFNLLSALGDGAGE